MKQSNCEPRPKNHVLGERPHPPSSPASLCHHLGLVVLSQGSIHRPPMGSVSDFLDWSS